MDKLYIKTIPNEDIPAKRRRLARAIVARLQGDELLQEEVTMLMGGVEVEEEETFEEA